MKDALTHIRQSVFGMTQAAFGRAIGVNQSTISRWERGELQPSGDEMSAIRTLARTREIAWNDSWFFEVPASAEPNTIMGVG